LEVLRFDPGGSFAFAFMNKHEAAFLCFAVGVGAMLGAGMGVALRNIALGAGIGAAAGAVYGVMLAIKNKKG
jgi:hypothetical protein